MDGHVFDSVMRDLEGRLPGGIPRGWNAKSRCRPNEEEEVDRLLGELRKLHARVGRAAQQAGKVKDVPEAKKMEVLKDRMLKDLEWESRDADLAVLLDVASGSTCLNHRAASEAAAGVLASISVALPLLIAQGPSLEIALKDLKKRV